MAEPRIAVDARPLCHPGTGIYRYTREMLTRMCRLGGEWFLYSPQAYDVECIDLPNVHHCIAGVPPALRASQLAQFFFPLWLKRDRVEQFWGPRHQLPGLPRTVRAAVTVHDLVWKDHPDTMRFPGRQLESFFTPRALARADAITVVSQFTRRRLEHYFPEYADKITVVPGASMLCQSGAAVEVADSAGEGGYFLFVGTLEPRKNLPRLLRAYCRYAAADVPVRPLKIVGGAGWGGENIAGLVAALGLANQVKIVGTVDDATLRQLYSQAHALLLPSLYEGFGLPVIEALSMGVPVITSRDSAMSEVAGGAGLYVDPESELEMCSALCRMSAEDELYQLLRSKATAEVRRYDWDVSASTMAGILMP